MRVRLLAAGLSAAVVVTGVATAAGATDDPPPAPLTASYDVDVSNGSGRIAATMRGYPDGATIRIRASAFEDAPVFSTLTLRPDGPSTRGALRYLPQRSWALCGVLTVRAEVEAPGFATATVVDQFRTPWRCPPVRPTPASLASNWRMLRVQQKGDALTVDAVRLTARAARLHAYDGPVRRTTVTYAWLRDGLPIATGRRYVGDPTGVTVRVGVQRPWQHCVFSCPKIYFRPTYRVITPAGPAGRAGTPAGR